jgi:hypothetical protein
MEVYSQPPSPGRWPPSPQGAMGGGAAWPLVTWAQGRGAWARGYGARSKGQPSCGMDLVGAAVLIGHGGRLHVPPPVAYQGAGPKLNDFNLGIL